jgi:hypothetical protein
MRRRRDEIRLILLAAFRLGAACRHFSSISYCRRESVCSVILSVGATDISRCKLAPI